MVVAARMQVDPAGAGHEPHRSATVQFGQSRRRVNVGQRGRRAIDAIAASLLPRTRSALNRSPPRRSRMRAGSTLGATEMLSVARPSNQVSVSGMRLRHQINRVAQARRRLRSQPSCLLAALRNGRQKTRSHVRRLGSRANTARRLVNRPISRTRRARMASCCERCGGSRTGLALCGPTGVRLRNCGRVLLHPRDRARTCQADFSCRVCFPEPSCCEWSP